MRVVLLALGSRGDVAPMVGLGRELVRRELPVSLVALRDYRPLAEAAGVPFVGIDRSLAESTAAVRAPASRLAGSPLTYTRGVARWLGEIAPAVVAAELAAVGPGDLVVAGLLSYDDAAALREARGCRVVHASYAPLLPTVAGVSGLVSVRPGGSTRLNRWAGIAGVAGVAGMCTTTGRSLRAALGLPRTSAGDFVRLVRSTPTLLAVSPTLVPPAPDWPAHVWQTGAWLDEAPAWEPPARLRSFLDAGEPPVFVSFGSIVGGEDAADLELVARAAVLAGRRVVVGTTATPPADLPASVHVLADAPYRSLFGRVAAVVHHGGAGTVTEALLAGVPSGTVALGADQPFYGRRLHELGVGPAVLPRRKLTVDRLAALLGVLTGPDSERYRAAAQRARTGLSAERGVPAAADRVGALVEAR